MGIKLTNNAFGTLAAGINSSATSITLTSGQGARFPTLSAGDYFYATLIDTSNNLEIVKCTARSTDVLTVTRAQESTTARAYNTGDRLEIRLTAATFLDASAALDGDKGDITVSSTGSVWTIDNLAVTDAKIAAMAASKLTGRVPAANAPSGSVIQFARALVTTTSEVQLGSGGVFDTVTVSITPTFANSTIGLFHNPTFLYRSTASTNNWLRIYGRINGSSTAMIKDWSCYSDGTLVHGFRQDRPVEYFYVPGTTATQTLGFRFLQAAGFPCIVGDGELRNVWAMEIAP